MPRISGAEVRGKIVFYKRRRQALPHTQTAINKSYRAMRVRTRVNAEYFFARGALSLIYEHNLTPRSLETAVSAAYADRFNFKRRLNKLGFENANTRVANVLLSYRKSPQA